MVLSFEASVRGAGVSVTVLAFVTNLLVTPLLHGLANSASGRVLRVAVLVVGLLVAVCVAQSGRRQVLCHTRRI